MSQGVGCLGGKCVRALLNLWHLFAQNLIRHAYADPRSGPLLMEAVMEGLNNIIILISVVMIGDCIRYDLVPKI